MAKSLIRKEYPLITCAEYKKIMNVISLKCSEYYFLGFLRCSNGNVDDAINFFFLDEKLRALLTQYLMRLEIQLKSDFASMVEKETRSSQFWKVKKYYSASAKTKMPGEKRTNFYKTKSKIQEEIDRISPVTIGPLNYVAMYSISFGSFAALFRQIDSTYKQTFVDKYTSHLSVHTPSLMFKYLNCIRVLRNRCAHGNHIITKKFVDALAKNGGISLTNTTNNPIPGRYVSFLESILIFMIKQLSCGKQFKFKLKTILNSYTSLLARYPSRHSLASDTVSKIL